MGKRNISKLIIISNNMTKLFKPFQQIDSGLSRQREGTGLGLSICKKLAGLLNGELKLKSQWEIGSTFTLMLPLDDFKESKK